MAMKFGAPVWPFEWDAPYERAIRRIFGRLQPIVRRVAGEDPSGSIDRVRRRGAIPPSARSIAARVP